MTNQEIKTVGQTIAQETQIGGNTAERVGGVIEGIGEALDNKDAAVGYYLATMSGSAIYINASSYRLGTGGNLRAKMPAAATTACTLTVGNANAVPLWYNGAAVSADNSWEAGEIVTIFYDGTRFMASNSQGGGGQFGSGEKIKDILLSQALGDGTGTITSQKGVSDAIFNEIDISSIDSLKTLNDALAPSSSLKPTYYTVTATLSNVKLKVGSMAVISDNMRHVVTEIMATHYLLDDAGNLTNEHSDAEIFFIYRSVKLSGGTLPDAAGVWTKWRYVNASVWSTAAEKIKYDNSASGLAARNVQDAIDEVSDAIFEFKYVAATLPTGGENKWINDSGVWASRTAKYYLVPVNEGEVYRLTANANGAVQYAFLTNNSTSGAASFVAGTSRKQCSPSSSIDLPVPATAAYLYVLYNINGTVRLSSLKIRTTVNALDKRINELDDAINDVQTSEERTVTCNLEGYTASNNKTYRMRYNCGTHGRATVNFTAPSNYVLKIFCLSSFSKVSDTIDSSNTIVSATNITPGVTKTITWDNSRAKYIVLSVGNTSNTALSESGVNTFKGSLNLVIEDLIGYDGLDKRVTDLETNVSQLNSLSGDVETLETDVSELKDLSYENVTIPASIRKANYWINDSQVWESLNNGRTFTLIEASEGDEFYIEGNASEPTYMYWLSDYVNPSNGGTPYIVDGTSKFRVNANASRNFTAPAGTKYLYLLYQITDERSGRPAKLTVRRGGNAPKQESSELYYNGEKISVGNRLQVTLLQQLTDTKSGSDSEEVEGFAVVNGYAAVTRLGGYITLYRLNGEKFYYLFCTKVSAFDSNNAANWGVEKYDDNDVLPLLYVSYQGGETAYVFRVQTNGTCTLVQTITISNLPSVYCGEWAIDKERGKLIFYTTSIGNPATGDAATTHGAKHRVVVWPMPALRDGNDEIISEVTLDYNEAEEAYVMEDQPNNNTGYDSTVGYVDAEGYYTWVYQGVAAKNGKLIIPCGGYSAKRRRGLRVWDMDARRQINYVDLTNPIYKNHPYWEIEDCDVVDGCVYLFCRGVGGAEWTFANVYKLDFD